MHSENTKGTLSETARDARLPLTRQKKKQLNMDCCVDVSLTTNVLECIPALAWTLGYRVMMAGPDKRLNQLF